MVSGNGNPMLDRSMILRRFATHDSQDQSEHELLDFFVHKNCKFHFPGEIHCMRRKYCRSKNSIKNKPLFEKMMNSF